MSAVLALRDADPANLGVPRPANDVGQMALVVERPSLLRFITCGSVDDGKSTLIGRLLYDSKAVLDDQLAALDKDSRRFGTQGTDLDFALLVDGLSAEREQGITIDVAYRYFSTARRSFIVADTPGHEQYTRNMATGASTAELAVILVDARKGILPQTRRHSFIVSMLGVRHVIVAINKMDLVGFDQEAFERIAAVYKRAALELGFHSITCIPLSAKMGDNVAERSPNMPWYQGPSLIEHLETVDTDGAVLGSDCERTPFRMAVQWVNRPNADFRGYAGTITSGCVAPGDEIAVLPTGARSRVARVITAAGDLERAVEGQAVTLTLQDERDVSRGSVIVAGSDQLSPRRALYARLLWMSERPLTPGAEYAAKLGTDLANATVSSLEHAVDIHTFEQRPAGELQVNGIGLARLAFDKAVVAVDYAEDRDLGGFILIDKLTNETVALALVDDAAARRARPREAASFNPVAELIAKIRRLTEEGLPVKGEPFSRFVARAVTWRLISAALLGLGIALLTSEAMLGLAVAVVDMLARPLLRLGHGLVFARASGHAKRRELQNFNADGGGI